MRSTRTGAAVAALLCLVPHELISVPAQLGTEVQFNLSK